jgi:hypothetical protein
VSVICVEVDRQRRHNSLDEQGEPEILHDDGVGPGIRDGFEALDRVGQFAAEDQGVEGDVTPDVMRVQKRNHARQIIWREVGRPVAGVEPRQAEVHRVRAVSDGRAEGVPIAGGGEQFGLAMVTYTHESIL